MKKKLAILFILTLINFKVTAKIHSWEEFIFAHISKNIFMAGEPIWYFLDVSSTHPDFLPGMAYAELVDRNGIAIEQIIIPLEKGLAEGKITISKNISSDHYLIRFYTRTSPFLGKQGIYSQFITVINPDKPVSNSTPAVNLSEYQFMDVLEVDLTPKIIDHNSKTTINLKTMEIPEKCIISVSIENPFLDKTLQGAIYSQIYDFKPIIESLTPEPYGHIIKAKDAKYEYDTHYYLSVHGKTNGFYTARPNTDGELFFELGGIKDFDYILAQKSNLKEALNFEIQSPFINLKFKEDFIFPNLKFVKENENFINDLIYSSQLGEYYYNEEVKSLQSVSQGLLADHTYLLDDYVRFETVESTLTEYVPKVFVRKRDKSTLFKVLNEPHGLIFNENPLLLIDNMPVFNVNDFANLNPKDILQIDLISRRYFHFDLMYSGIISLTSKNNDFGGFELPQNALLLEYYKFSTKIKNKTPHINNFLSDDRIPDFRSILYWNPEANESQEIELFSSQIKSRYNLIMSRKENGIWSVYKDFIDVQ